MELVDLDESGVVCRVCGKTVTEYSVTYHGSAPIYTCDECQIKEAVNQARQQPAAALAEPAEPAAAAQPPAAKPVRRKPQKKPGPKSREAVKNRIALHLHETLGSRPVVSTQTKLVIKKLGAPKEVKGLDSPKESADADMQVEQEDERKRKGKRKSKKKAQSDDDDSDESPKASKRRRKPPKSSDSKKGSVLKKHGPWIEERHSSVVSEDEYLKLGLTIDPLRPWSWRRPGGSLNPEPCTVWVDDGTQMCRLVRPDGLFRDLDLKRLSKEEAASLVGGAWESLPIGKSSRVMLVRSDQTGDRNSYASTLVYRPVRGSVILCEASLAPSRDQS